MNLLSFSSLNKPAHDIKSLIKKSGGRFRMNGAHSEGDMAFQFGRGDHGIDILQIADIPGIGTS